MTRTTLARENDGLQEPAMPVLPFVEVATRGHTGETYAGEDHARWLACLERRERDPYANDPLRPSIPPDISDDGEPGPDLE